MRPIICRQRKDPDDEFVKQHIPGALRFDIDEISDHNCAATYVAMTDRFDEAMQDLRSVQDAGNCVCWLFSAARGGCTDISVTMTLLFSMVVFQLGSVQDRRSNLVEVE